MGSIREQLELARDRQRRRLVSSTLDSRAVQELGAVRLCVDDLKLTQGGWKAVDSGLLRSYRRGRKAFGRARTRRSLEDLVGERVYAEKPKAFRRRMQRCFKAGRAAAEAPLGRRPAELNRATRTSRRG